MQIKKYIKTDQSFANLLSARCRICDENQLDKLFEWPEFPIFIWPIQQGARQEYERLQVYWCPGCGLVQLDRFDPAFIKKLYSKEVFGLVASGEFKATVARNNRFLEYCSEQLGERWADGKKLLDIGGYDVLTCCELNFAEGVICDPNAPAEILESRVRIVTDFFSRKYFEQSHFDVVVARHLLEHINDLSDFMDDLRYVLRDGGQLLIEVPELLGSIRSKGAFAVFYHQHVMYFDEVSLRNLLLRFGFKVLYAGIDNHLIRVIAQKQPLVREIVTYEKNMEVPWKVRQYRIGLDEYFGELIAFLEAVSREKIVCYGAGGGTTLLLNLCRPVRDYIEIVVDSSRNKIGKQVGGMDFIIKSPEAIAALPGRSILVNSDMFFNEIVDGLRANYRDRNHQILKIFSNFESFSLAN